MRETLEKISNNIHPEIKIVNTSKGFELNTLMSMSEIILETLNINDDQIITFYGPSHSEEVIKIFQQLWYLLVLTKTTQK